MEDQIFQTIDDSIKVLKDSWSKDIAEIRCMLQEMLGKVSPTAPRLPFGSRSSMETTSVKIPRFSGDDPAAWVFQVEQYFAYYKIFSDHKLSLASSYLDGEAQNWYCWLFRNKQLADWEHFVTKLFIRFRDRSREAPDRRLAFLQQLNTMDYCPAGSAGTPSWGTMAKTSPQPWTVRSESNNPNLARKVFEEMPDRTTETFQDDEAATESIELPAKHIEVDSSDNNANDSYTEFEALEGMETCEIGDKLCLVKAKHDAFDGLTFNEDASVQIQSEVSEFGRANKVFDKNSQKDQLMFSSLTLSLLDQILPIANIGLIFPKVHMRAVSAEISENVVAIITPAEIIQVREITPVGSSKSTCFSRLDFKLLYFENVDYCPMSCAEPRKLVANSLARTVRRVEDIVRMLGGVSQFPYDPGVNLFSKCHGAYGVCEFRNASGNLKNNKFMILNVWNAYIAPLLKLHNLVNANSLDNSCVSTLFGWRKRVLVTETSKTSARDLTSMYVLDNGSLFFIIEVLELSKIDLAIQFAARMTNNVGISVARLARPYPTFTDVPGVFINFEKTTYSYTLTEKVHEHLNDPSKCAGDNVPPVNAANYKPYYFQPWHWPIHNVAHTSELSTLELHNRQMLLKTTTDPEKLSFSWGICARCVSNYRVFTMSILIEVEIWLLSNFTRWCPCQFCDITLLRGSNHIATSLLEYSFEYLLEEVEVVVAVKYEKCWLIDFAGLILLLQWASGGFGPSLDDMKFLIWCHRSSPSIAALQTCISVNYTLCHFSPKSSDKTIVDKDLASGVANNMIESLILIALKVSEVVMLLISKYPIALSKESTTVGDVFYMESNTGAVTRMGRDDTFATKFALGDATYVPRRKSMLLYSNLEDKVLFEDGSIVMNHIHSMWAYRLEVINKTDPIEVIGPSKMLEGFIWDPGPISNCIKD